MYSVVLATMMTLTPSAPDTFLVHTHGCHGCYGYACWGCYGCTGCYGCYGSWTYSCYGCYGWSCGGCYGYYPWYSYYPGCCGGIVLTPAPAVVVPAKPKLPTPKGETSTVMITAPAGVRLSVYGQPLLLQGATQTFETPNLEPGRSFSYVFRAEAMRDGKAVVREQKVTVRAGQATQVDFSDLAPKAAARVTIVLPSDAKLIVDGVTYPEGKSKRTLETPDLEVGRLYSYNMRAEVVREGKVLRQERRVDVEAGKAVTVEFKDLPAILAAQR